MYNYRMIKELMSKEYSEETNDLLLNLNAEFIHAYVRYFVNKDKEALDSLRADAQKLNRIMSKSLKSDNDRVCYNLGAFHGAAILMDYLLLNLDGLQQIEKRVQDLEPWCNKVLMYLYQRPGARLDEVETALGVEHNTMNKLVERLEDVGCVKIYNLGSDAAYCELTIDGRIIVKQNLLDGK